MLFLKVKYFNPEWVERVDYLIKYNLHKRYQQND